MATRAFEGMALKDKSEDACEKAYEELMEIMMSGGHMGVRVNLTWQQFCMKLWRPRPDTDVTKVMERISTNCKAYAGNYVNILMFAILLFVFWHHTMAMAFFSVIESLTLLLPTEVLRKVNGGKPHFLRMSAVLACQVLMWGVAVFAYRSLVFGAILGVLLVLAHAAFASPDTDSKKDN